MVDYTVCSTCAQCIAICPKQAINWDDNKPSRFDPSLYPGPRQLEELFMERRTIRDYTRQKIDRSILEEITGFAAYAPTHNFNFRAVIIDDDAIIKQIDYLIYESSVKIYKWFYKPGFMHSLIKLIAPSREFEYLKARPKLDKVEKRNSGFKSKPAAVIMIVGDRRVPLSLESAQYALYNIDLYAQSKGIACRNLVGNQMILNRNRNFKKSMGIGKHEKIFATITLGYPAVKFRNKVIGKSINIQWNASIN
jgi:nitroreductase